MAKKTIRLQVFKIAPDFTTYKQYGISLSHPSLYVEVSVDDKEVAYINGKVGDPDYIVVLTPAGLAQVAQQIAEATDKVHDAWLKNN